MSKEEYYQKIHNYLALRFGVELSFIEYMRPVAKVKGYNRIDFGKWLLEKIHYSTGVKRKTFYQNLAVFVNRLDDLEFEYIVTYEEKDIPGIKIIVGQKELDNQVQNGA